LLAAPSPAVRDAVMRAARDRGLGAALVLAALAAAMPLASLRAAFSALGTALVLAPHAPAVGRAVPRAACSSSGGTPLLLAPLAPPMRLALLRRASSGRCGAALEQAASATAVGHAVLCAAASSRLGAALVKAPFPASVRDAVLRAACSSRSGAARVLAPPASAVRGAALVVACNRCGRATLFLTSPAAAVRLAHARHAVSCILAAALFLALPLRPHARRKVVKTQAIVLCGCCQGVRRPVHGAAGCDAEPTRRYVARWGRGGWARVSGGERLRASNRTCGAVAYEQCVWWVDASYGTLAGVAAFRMPALPCGKGGVWGAGKCVIPPLYHTRTTQSSHCKPGARRRGGDLGCCCGLTNLRGWELRGLVRFAQAVREKRSTPGGATPAPHDGWL
jgi:hypothetical protein